MTRARRPLDIDALPAGERAGLGAAGLRTFANIAAGWGLSDAEHACLLGIDVATLAEWRRELPSAPVAYTTELLTRLSVLLGIYAALQLAFSAGAFADAWITAANAGQPYAGRSPLAFMIEGGLQAMLHVRRLLEYESGP